MKMPLVASGGSAASGGMRPPVPKLPQACLTSDASICKVKGQQTVFRTRTSALVCRGSCDPMRVEKMFTSADTFKGALSILSQNPGGLGVALSTFLPSLFSRQLCVRFSVCVFSLKL